MPSGMQAAHGCYVELHRGRHIVATIGALGGVVGQGQCGLAITWE